MGQERIDELLARIVLEANVNPFGRAFPDRVRQDFAAALLLICS
jgi:hypothetical protein